MLERNHICFPKSPKIYMIAFSHVKGKEKQPVEAICQSAQWSLESPEDADCMVEMGLCTVYYIYCTEVVLWRGDCALFTILHGSCMVEKGGMYAV